MIYRPLGLKTICYLVAKASFFLFNSMSKKVDSLLLFFQIRTVRVYQGYLKPLLFKVRTCRNEILIVNGFLDIEIKKSLGVVIVGDDLSLLASN